jgi:hemolysin activation/secretion protein
LAYLQAEAHFSHRRFAGETQWRGEIALPNSDARFSKISGRAAINYRLPGLQARWQGNLGTSFGPDRLPLQDVFHGEGAEAKTRFQNDKVKTIGDWTTGAHRLVEGGGNLRGYTGTPLLSERYATFNLELSPAMQILGLSPFIFYDRGAIWPTRDANSLTRANAGAALSFGGSPSRLFGAALFSELAFRVYFPLWLSHPLPGEEQRQFRWYFALGKSL